MWIVVGPYQIVKKNLVYCRTIYMITIRDESVSLTNTDVRKPRPKYSYNDGTCPLSDEKDNDTHYLDTKESVTTTKVPVKFSTTPLFPTWLC